MSKKGLVAIGVLALFVATAGFVVAGGGSPPKTAKACVNSNGALRLKVDGCGANDPITLVGKRYQGVAKAYAHINPDGTLDTTRSWNVSSSDMVTTNDGFYCFRSLGFTPEGAQLTLDYNGLLNGQIPAIELILPADPGDCDLASAQLEVFTGLVNPGVFTSGEHIGFYIWIY